MKKKWLVILFILLIAAPALAATDSWVRSQVRELSVKVQGLSEQNQALAAQVQELTMRVQYLESLVGKK